MAASEDMETDEVSLLDFPDEMLVKIFSNFEYMQLLDMSHVCTRFEKNAKDAFAMVYNGKTNDKYFKMKIHNSKIIGEQTMYRPFFETFGKSMVALSVNFRGGFNMIKEDHWLFEMIRYYCTSLTHLSIESHHVFDPAIIFRTRVAPKLTNLTVKGFNCDKIHGWAQAPRPQLTSLCVVDVRQFGQRECAQLLQSNPQLKHLRVELRYGPMIKIFQLLNGRLNRFRTLEILTQTDNKEREFIADVVGEGLQSLAVSVEKRDCVKILKMIAPECRFVEQLNIYLNFKDEKQRKVDDEFFELIGSFPQIKSLTLKSFIIEFDTLFMMMTRLPKLMSLHLISTKSHKQIAITPENVLNLFATFSSLKQMTCNLQAIIDHVDFTPFDVNFHRRFIDIVRDRGTSHMFKLMSWWPGSTVLFTEEKFVGHGELQHWIECEIDYSRSRTHFLNLNEACIARIVDYLGDDDVRRLYETCTLTKKAVAAKISDQHFEVSIQEDFNGAMDLIRRFGEHMAKLKVDMENADDTNIITLWSLIGRVCSKSLVELTIHHGEANQLNSLNLSFPKLEVLKLEEITSIGPYVFPLMNCQKLSQLFLISYKIDFDMHTTQFGIPLDGLKCLKLKEIDIKVIKAIRQLSDDISAQMREFTMIDCRISGVEMINVAIRFQNLIALNFIDYCSYTSKFEKYSKRLFNSCCKLEKLSLLYSRGDTCYGIMEHIKTHCTQLKLLQLQNDQYQSDEFDESNLEKISKLFPNVKINLISHDPDINDDEDDYYTVETYSRLDSQELY